MLARLFCLEQLTSGIPDATLNHQVVAHLEIFNAVPTVIQLSCAGAFAVVAAVQGESEGGLALTGHVADFEHSARVCADAPKGREVGNDGIAAVHQVAVGLVDPVAAGVFGFVIGECQSGIQRVYALASGFLKESFFLGYCGLVFFGREEHFRACEVDAFGFCHSMVR